MNTIKWIHPISWISWQLESEDFEELTQVEWDNNKYSKNEDKWTIRKVLHVLNY
jgi:hypothetical protein